MTASEPSRMHARRPIGIRIADLTVSIGAGVQLFDGFGIDFPAGSTTCVLGPSGIGKSALLRAVLGLDGRAGNGLVRSAGTVMDDGGRTLTGQTAYMAQQDLLLPWLSAIENVCVGDRLRGALTSQSRVRAFDLLARVGLADEAGHRPGALSGGMRQRVALARTLYEDRPVVLMDEPYSKLDALTRERLQLLAARLLAGRTAIMVTHDPMEALMLGHRIVVLNGRPARVAGMLEPPDVPPRDLNRADLPPLRRELIDRLGLEAA